MSVEYQLQDDVAVVTLNRPDRFNAIETTLAAGVVEAASRAGEEARALVLTGSGKAFCSGADLTEMLDAYEDGGPDLGRYLDEIFHPMVHALTECMVPTVGAINGVAAGAGLGVALGLDLRIMAESAFFTSAFTAIGLAPDSGTTWWLPHTVGVSKALELTLTNKRVSAHETLDMGLCVEVVSDDELMERAVDLAAGLADMVPDSLVATRRLVRGAAALTFEEALAAEQEEQARLGRTPEHIEGVNAFLEKRKADFRNPSQGLAK